MRVDLDALERAELRLGDFNDLADVVRGAAAELRVARKVVDTRRSTPAKGNSLVWDIWWDRHHGPALAAYDQAVSP